MQLSLWQAPPVERPTRVLIFRAIIKSKLYTSPHGRLLEQWLDTTDFLLFTADGHITTEEVAAAYVMARRQGTRIQYVVWRAHYPELYDKEKLFDVDAGHAWESADAATWKKFTHDNDVTVIKTETQRSCLGKGVLG